MMTEQMGFWDDAIDAKSDVLAAAKFAPAPSCESTQQLKPLVFFPLHLTSSAMVKSLELLEMGNAICKRLPLRRPYFAST
jgi:hypothetical protein